MSKYIASKAKMKDIETRIKAGIDPTTGLPTRMKSALPIFLKENIKSLKANIEITIKKINSVNMQSGS